MESLQRIYLQSLSVARALIASSEVAAHWDEPSALREFSVHGLAGHLARAATSLARALDAPAPDSTRPVTATGYILHYVEADSRDLSSPGSTGVRRRGEEQAAGGQEHLVADLDRTIRTLEDRLSHEPDDRLLRVLDDLAIRLDEYLKTRLVELAVHIDDLVVSVGLPMPQLLPAAIDVAIDTLLDVARRSHGDLAVLRALTRRERDAVNALRVL